MKISVIPPIIIPVWNEINTRSKLYKELIINKQSRMQYDLKIDYDIIAFDAQSKKNNSSGWISKHYLIVRSEYDEKAISTNSYDPYVYKLTLLGKADSDKVKHDFVWIEFYNGSQVVDEETFPAIHLNDWKII